MDLGHKVELFVELVKTNFKLRYKGSFLGFIWVLLKPFSIFLLLFLVFSKFGSSLSGQSTEEYAISLLMGIVLFTFFSEGTIWGMNSLLDKANIILKINFDRTIAVASSVALAVINLVTNIFIIFVVSYLVGIRISLAGFFFLSFILLTFVLVISAISLFSSLLLVKLRDLSHIAELLLQLIFYGSAIFYPIEIVPEKWRFLIELNPVAILINSARSIVLWNKYEDVQFILIVFFLSTLGLLGGWMIFSKKVKKVAEFF